MLVSLVYLLSLVVWIGGIIFFSLVATPLIFKNLPPEWAGKTVAALFPKYFMLGSVSGIVAFLCLLIDGFRTGNWSLFKLLIIVIMVFLTVTNSLITHPKARALKEEIQITTSQTELVHMKEIFDRVHRWSVINNGIVLLLGLVLIFLTARRLQI